MRPRFWALWFSLSAVGVALTALPDDDDRLFSFSRTHGPAPLDALGAVFVLAGWSILWGSVWRRRQALPKGTRWRVGMTALLVIGAVITVWAIRGDHGAWWYLGASIVAAVQIAAAIAVTPVRRR